MKNYVKAYEYMRHVLGMLLVAALVSLLFVFLMNLLPGSLAAYRIWLEANTLPVLIVIFVMLIAWWHDLMPTIRTLLKLKKDAAKSTLLQRLKDNERLLILFAIGMLLLGLAIFQDVRMFEPFLNHPVRYTYLSYIFLSIVLIAFISKITAPSGAKIGMGRFVNDDPRDGARQTESQLQATTYLAGILASGMPRSVALTGDWGSGKTAVYRQARAKAAEDHPEIIWVDFDPWRYASEEALVRGFYESIAKQIDSDIPGFQNALRSIAHSVNQLIGKSDSSGLFQAITGTIKGMATSISPDVVIKGLLDREGKRLVVVMDDLERQYDTERTYRALQLVHHAKTMGKDNVQVLCIFEKATLLRAAPLHAPSREEYLEKFSEIEISIPPPNESSLRSQLEELLGNKQYSRHLPRDLSLNLSPASVKDIKSHRGIIRAFNELLIEFISTEKRNQELEAEVSGEDTITYVDYSDRFLMGHLKLKYPSVYRDVAAHRDYYTQPKEQDEDMSTMFMDEDELNKIRRVRVETLLDEANLTNEQRDALKGLLADLFPVLGSVINESNTYINLTELREKRKVGHRDVLDAYFALTASQDAYIQHQKWITELLANAADADDAQLIEHFKKYIALVRGDSSEADGITLLRNELLKRKHKDYQLRAFRAWMRAILGDTEAGIESNRALGRILSAINDIAQRSQPEERLNIGKYTFYEVTNYMAKPYTALLLLLFLLPERGNSYLTEYVAQKAFKQGGLYQRVLKWVDQYFAKHQINIYKAYEYKDWAFIAYQWALSSCSAGSVLNDKVIGSASRYKKVNEYLFSMLEQDDKTAHDFIYKSFWNAETNEDGDAGWRINSEKVVPYTADRLLKLAKRLEKSGSLSGPQKKTVRSFAESLEVLVTDVNA